MGRRAAVAIGVNRPANLDPLHAAAQAASEVAAWLAREGFDVTLLTDEREAVHASAVEEALASFVKAQPSYKLLVVYFSGHGYWHARADRWLLSGAPELGSDAINLSGAMDLARYSGIETVVFFSDACRSIPQTAQEQRVEGVDGFPNLSGVERPNKVDSFKATSVARSAYEIRLPERPHRPTGWTSVLTTAWRAAYEEASDDMVVEVAEDQGAVLVVPNRRLENFLQHKVDELLSTTNNPTLSQFLDINVPSADDVYVGRVDTRSALRSASQTPRATPGQVAATAVTNLLDFGIAPVASDEDDLHERGLEPGTVVDHFESECGIVVTGGLLSPRITTTTGDYNARAEWVQSGDGTPSVPGLARLWNVTTATSVVAQLLDGRCFVIPALAGYLGHVAVDESGVANVAYVPSAQGDRYWEYQARRAEIDRFRALVAIAVDHNTLVLRDAQQAWRLADEIRVVKSLDPSLGLYAAHAYSRAGMDGQIESLLWYMAQDIRTTLFDVALLASRGPTPQFGIVPFCPLLTQAWSLLRPRGWQLHPILEAAKPALLDSLWTTFKADVADGLFDAVERGVLA